jgi:hypothetical protein
VNNLKIEKEWYSLEEVFEILGFTEEDLRELVEELNEEE